MENHRFALALRVLLVVFFLWMIQDLLVPLALGGLFAILLYPVNCWLARKLGRFSSKAPLIATLGVFILIVIPFAFIAARVIAAINDFISKDLDTHIASVRDTIQENLAWLGKHLPFESGDLWAKLGTLVQRIGTAIAAGAGSIAASIPDQIISAFIYGLSLYFFLRDGRAFLHFLRRLLPFDDTEVDSLFSSINDTIRGALLGQIATSGVQGALTLLALLVFSVPGAFVLAILAALFSLIPMIGTTPITVGATIYLFVKGRTGVAIGMAVAAVLIGLSDNVVRPWVQSSHVRLHPLALILGIFGGLATMGPAGVFLGPVVVVIALWCVDGYQRSIR